MLLLLERCTSLDLKVQGRGFGALPGPTVDNTSLFYFLYIDIYLLLMLQIEDVIRAARRACHRTSVEDKSAAA